MFIPAWLAPIVCFAIISGGVFLSFQVWFYTTKSNLQDFKERLFWRGFIFCYSVAALIFGLVKLWNI